MEETVPCVVYVSNGYVVGQVRKPSTFFQTLTWSDARRQLSCLQLFPLNSNMLPQRSYAWSTWHISVEHLHQRRQQRSHASQRYLEDAGRIWHHHLCTRNWYRKHDRKASTLDYFLILNALKQYNKTATNNGYRTDNCLVELNTKLSKINQSFEYWKFKNQLLKDKEYVQLIDSMIHETMDEYYESRNKEDLSSITLSSDRQILLEILKCKNKISYNTVLSCSKQDQERKRTSKTKKMKYWKKY